MVEIRLATEEDVPGIITLMQANKRENLSVEEQRRHGFVQGNMTQSAMIERIHALGVDVAVDKGLVVAAALTTRIGESAMPGPLGAALEVAPPGLYPGQFYFYGPAVVDVAYRGQHLLTRILDAQFGRLSACFSQVAAFIDEGNPVSMAAHIRLGFEDIGQFFFKDRSYHLLRRDLT